MDLEGMDEMKFVSINSEYLIVSNANKDCIKIPMDLDILIQLISQAGDALVISSERREQEKKLRNMSKAMGDASLLQYTIKY
tara:strand:+ start:5270 stop:5515 length:246 start_codon:yes stop_codon:yes gene_type:complete